MGLGCCWLAGAGRKICTGRPPAHPPTRARQYGVVVLGVWWNRQPEIGSRQVVCVQTD